MGSKVLASQALPSEILGSKRVLVFCNSLNRHIQTLRVNFPSERLTTGN